MLYLGIKFRSSRQLPEKYLGLGSPQRAKSRKTLFMKQLYNFAQTFQKVQLQAGIFMSTQKVLDLSQNKLIVLSELWQNLDLSALEELIVYQKRSLFFNFDFAKAQLDHKNIKLFWICSDGKLKHRNKTNLFWSLGVKNVRTSRYQ